MLPRVLLPSHWPAGWWDRLETAAAGYLHPETADRLCKLPAKLTWGERFRSASCKCCSASVNGFEKQVNTVLHRTGCAVQVRCGNKEKIWGRVRLGVCGCRAELHSEAVLTLQQDMAHGGMLLSPPETTAVTQSRTGIVAGQVPCCWYTWNAPFPPGLQYAQRHNSCVFMKRLWKFMAHLCERRSDQWCFPVWCETSLASTTCAVSQLNCSLAKVGSSGWALSS